MCMIEKHFFDFLLVGLGAIPGAFFRWIIDNDFAVNVFGAYVLGFVMGLKVNSRFGIIFGIGFCGACTTFSSWMVKIIQLLNIGLLLDALLLIVSTMFFGLLALVIGFFLGKRINELILS